MKQNALQRCVAGVLIFLVTTLPVPAVQTVRTQQAAKAPVTEDGLIRLLSKRFPLRELTVTLVNRGVSFELTDPYEQEIKRAGQYLGPKGVAILLQTVRDNLRRPPVTSHRVSYRVLQGHAIDLLLHGKIDRAWDPGLAGKTFIVPNDVFKTLSNLVRRFSSRAFSGEVFYNAEQYLHDEETYRNTRLARQFGNGRRRLFVGSVGDPAYHSEPEPTVSTLDSSLLFRTLNDPDKAWRLNGIYKGEIQAVAAAGNAPPEVPAPRRRRQRGRRPSDGAQVHTEAVDLFSFSRFVSHRSDFALFEQTALTAFYLHITRNHLPSDFAVIYVHQDLEGQECPDGTVATSVYTDANLAGPLLSLNVAVLENLSNEPMSVGRIVFKENNADRLRNRDEERKALESLPFQRQNLFSHSILRPGEKLVIPLELLLNVKEPLAPEDPTVEIVEEYTEDGSTPIEPTAYPDVLARVRARGGIKYFYKEGRSIGPVVSPEALERIVHRPPINFESANEYLYGPSVAIESVDINRYGYLVKQFDSKRLMITSAGLEEGGSCPYIYTRSAAGEPWRSEGVILYGYSSKDKESDDEILLQRFDGTVLIREKDPEDSFIDHVQIRAVSADGQERILRPKNIKLLSVDGDYVILKRGEELLIHFDIPDGFVASEYVLEASGYYVPYKAGSGTPAGRRVMRSAPRRLRYGRVRQQYKLQTLQIP